MPFPGSDFTTISGKIKSFTSGPTTERLLIIGTAVDGPLNAPIRATDSAEVERVFGPTVYSGGYKNPTTGTADSTNNGGTLPRAFAQAIAAGCTDIYLCRATGTLATAPSAQFANANSRLDVRSLFPGRIYNDVFLGFQASGGTLLAQVTQPSSKGETYTTSYASSLTIGEVLDKVNGFRKNRTFEIIKETYSTMLASSCLRLACSALHPSGGPFNSTPMFTVGLSGGTNGTNAPGEDFYTSLDGYASALTATDFGTFDQLLGQKFRFNIAVLTGIHLDDQVVTSGASKPGGGTYSAADEYSISIATDYDLWLDRVSQVVSPCFGIIACRPSGIRNINTFIQYITGSLLEATAGKWNATLRWNKAGYFLYTGWSRNDSVAGVVDMGQRLGVCAGPEVVFNEKNLGSYSDMFHVAYASLLTTYPPERAPIFKPIPGIVSYGMPIPAKYAEKLVQGVGYDSVNDLSGRGAYTVLTRNPRDSQGPMVIFDDVTAAFRDDYMRNYQLVHLCNHIHLSLDNALGNFIGGPTGPSTLAAMETQIQNTMDGYVLSNALRGPKGIGYDFKITMTGTDQALGTIRVFVEISPATALRKIYFVVAVRQNG